MNIFYLDKDIDKCAEAHIDKHVTKMILEYAQLLCTALWINDSIGYYPNKLESEVLSIVKEYQNDNPVDKSIRYKGCFHNHPCAIWLRESYNNYEYLWTLTGALNDEAMFRGFKSHKSWEVVKNLETPSNFKSIGLTKPAQAMLDEFKQEDSILAYRAYYQGPKADFATYTLRTPPSWFEAEWVEKNNKWIINNAG